MNTSTGEKTVAAVNPHPEWLTPKEALEAIKQRLAVGAITYEEAKELARIPLFKINSYAETIAKKHGMRHKPITFIGFMR